jgi:hypothetical protein
LSPTTSIPTNFPNAIIARSALPSSALASLFGWWPYRSGGTVQPFETVHEPIPLATQTFWPRRSWFSMWEKNLVSVGGRHLCWVIGQRQKCRGISRGNWTGEWSARGSVEVFVNNKHRKRGIADLTSSCWVRSRAVKDLDNSLSKPYLKGLNNTKWPTLEA